MIDKKSFAEISGSEFDPGIGVCLGSSFLGFYAHAGFLKGLSENGVRPGHIAGCSAGAVVAGLCAAGWPPDHIIADLLSMGFLRTFFEAGVPLRGLAMTFNASRVTGLLTGDGFRRHLRRALGDRRIEDCIAPRLSIAVTNLTTASSEILRHGPLVEAISASAAVPLLFGAVRVEESYCWDGGLSNCLPVDALCADERIHTVIAHRIIRRCESRPRRRGGRPGVSDAFNLAHQAMGDRIFDIEYEKLVASGRRIIICETESPRLPFTQKRREHCIELGRATAVSHAARFARSSFPPLTLQADAS